MEAGCVDSKYILGEGDLLSKEVEARNYRKK